MHTYTQLKFKILSEVNQMLQCSFFFVVVSPMLRHRIQGVGKYHVHIGAYHIEQTTYLTSQILSLCPKILILVILCP